MTQGAPTRGRSCAYNRGTQAKKPMEILDQDIMSLLADLEADLDCRYELDGIDADELLDDEA